MKSDPEFSTKLIASMLTKMPYRELVAFSKDMASFGYYSGASHCDKVLEWAEKLTSQVAEPSAVEDEPALEEAPSVDYATAASPVEGI